VKSHSGRRSGGISSPRRLLRGRFRGISEAKLLGCMTLLGRDVQIEGRRLDKSLFALIIAAITNESTAKWTTRQKVCVPVANGKSLEDTLVDTMAAVDSCGC